MGAAKILLNEYSAVYSAKAGSIMPVFAISLMAMFSVAAAAIALSMDSSAARQLQVTADTAALGGATAFTTSSAPRAEDRLVTAQVQAEALANGNSEYYLTNLDVASVTEDAYGQQTRITVALQFDPVNIMAKFAGRNANIAIQRSATAEATRGFPLCVLTLDTSGEGISVLDAAHFQAKNCIIWSNSTDTKSFKFDGGDVVTLHSCTAGQASITGGAQVSPAPQEECDPLPDPLANWNAPTPGPCDETDFKVSKSSGTTLKPGVYCGGIVLEDENVTFDPGIYFILGGDLEITSQGVINAEGVTLLIGTNNAAIKLESYSTLNLIAPTEGPTAGFAIGEIPDPNGLLPTNADMMISGDLNIEGVLYLPHYDIEVKDEGGGKQESPYLQMVVNRLILKGNSRITINHNEAKTNLPVVIKPERTARLVD